MISRLQTTHGLGVRPAPYSRVKSAMTRVAELALVVQEVVGDAERRATCRAAPAVAGEQQEPNRAGGLLGASQGAVRRVTPTTSCPASRRSAAATELSTPPLSPTTIATLAVSLLLLLYCAVAGSAGEARVDPLELGRRRARR